jgi:hypothetical protein
VVERNGATRRRAARRRQPERPTTHDVQAAVEGVVLPAGDDGKVELLGRTFHIAEQIGIMPLLMFAVKARDGIRSDDMEGLASMYLLIKDCIDQDEWEDFRRHAIDTKAKDTHLLDVVAQVIAVHATRPTSPPGDSPTGRRNTSRRLKASSRPDGDPDDGMVSVSDLAGL